VPVSDADLVDALERVLERRVTSFRRRRWCYTSSAPIEELTIQGCPTLLFKDLSARSYPAPAFVVDPLRELEIYATHLTGLNAPPFVGGVATRGRAWLFLQRIDGIPLWQAEGERPWLATARWLARLHRITPPARSGRLLVRDRALLARWAPRALATERAGDLAGIEEASDRAIEILRTFPASLIHGDFYPSNVIVRGSCDEPTICPIDWEMGGIGAGVLDLAALISGDHQPHLRRRIVDAYRGALHSVPDNFDEGLRAARLLVALQWIGWQPGWTPPADHAHDWVADALAFSQRRQS